MRRVVSVKANEVTAIQRDDGATVRGRHLEHRPIGQGLLIYGVLKAKGVPARLVYFPDENHWVLKARNSLYWHKEVYEWLARWLKG